MRTPNPKPIPHDRLEMPPTRHHGHVDATTRERPRNIPPNSPNTNNTDPHSNTSFSPQKGGPYGRSPLGGAQREARPSTAHFVRAQDDTDEKERSFRALFSFIRGDGQI